MGRTYQAQISYFGMRHIGLLFLFSFAFTNAFDTNYIFGSLEQIDNESEENDDPSMESIVDLKSDFDNVKVNYNKGKTIFSRHFSHTLQGSDEDKEQKGEENEREGESNLAEKTNEEHKNTYQSYVLWRPSVFDDSGLLQSHQHLLSFLGNFMSEGQVEENKVEESDSAGWKDDLKEMDLPRVSALTSRDEPTMYDNLVNTVNSMKETVNNVASRPEVKDNMSYILMGLMGFLLLMLLNENLFGKSKPSSVQNHYLLQDTGAAAKLPTYEECMKAEKNILVSIGDKDVFNKVDLSLPVFAVTKDKGGNN